MKTVVALLAKAPRPGLVKTRLTAEVGVERAVMAYRAVGTQVVAGVAAGYRLCVWYDPPDAEGEMRAWLGDLEFKAQPSGDLGQRLRHAFATHFARGDAPVIAIGADAPGVDASLVAAAEERLSRADVVLGPALDGGYYLIGLRRSVPQLFARIPWGTPRVFQVTLAVCARCHLEVSALEPLRDLDTAADLAALGLERP